MLHAGSDNVAWVTVTAKATSGLAESSYGSIVGLSSARDKHNLVGPGANEGRHLASRPIDRRSGLLAKGVYARCIAKLFDQIGQHCLDHAPVRGRGRTVIEIDPACYCHVIQSGPPTSSRK